MRRLGKSFPIALFSAVLCSSIAYAGAADSIWTIHTHTKSLLVEGKAFDTTTGTGFHIERSAPFDEKVTIGWRVVPTGPNPVSADDFEDGELPSGEFILLPGYAGSQTIYFESLKESFLQRMFSWIFDKEYFGLITDNQTEGPEFWSVQLFDPHTGKEIPASLKGSETFSVSDEPPFK